MFITAIIDAEDRKDILKSIISISFNLDYLSEIINNVDSEELVKILFAEVNLEIWKKEREAIFNEAIEDDTRYYFLTECLESKCLSDQEFEAGFDCLTEREDIIERIGLPYFYRLMRMYPQAIYLLRSLIDPSPNPTYMQA